jgi:N utilization substance protein B
MKFSRRRGREWALQMLTAADLNTDVDIDTLIEDYWRQLPTLDEEACGTAGERVSGGIRAFVEERVRGVTEKRDELDAVLAGLLVSWDLARLGTVERAVLRLGLWELRHSDVPRAVVINEAVDLVNWFSGPKSRALVNGVLDKAAGRT